MSCLPELFNGAGELCEVDMAAPAAGLRDGFYQMSVPEMAKWFAVEDAVAAGDFGISECWCDERRAMVPVSGDTPIYLCMEAMCMGWSWALCFCNEVCLDAARESAVHGDAGIIRDKRPPPTLDGTDAVHSVYADNYIALGLTRPLAERAHSQGERMGRKGDDPDLSGMDERESG